MTAPAEELPDGHFLHEPLLGAEFNVSHILRAAAREPHPAIDGYEVQEEVVSGPCGSVYRARELGSAGRKVAIKLLSTHAIGPGARRRLRQEVQSLATLDHPSIAHLLGDGVTTDGRAYCVLEWVEGVPMRAAAADPAFSLHDRVVAMHELASALTHAHAKGVLHRDLSPANAIIRPVCASSRLCLIDFGLARIAAESLEQESPSDRTREGAPMGTPGYMSPEQLEGSWSRVDARSEVFAAGVMLYELLSGQLPWPVRDQTFSGAHRLLRTQPPAPIMAHAPRVDANLAAVIHKAIAVDQSYRYQSMAELASDLERWLVGAPVTARMPSVRETALRVARQHPMATAMGVLLAAALGVTAVMGGSLVRGMQRERDLVQAQALLNLESGMKLADRSGVREQRREFLQHADRLSAQLLSQTPDSLEIKRMRARVLTELSKLEREGTVDGLSRAGALRREALGILDTIIAQGATAADRRAHAIGIILCGDIDKEQGDAETARALYEQALAEHQALAAFDPRDVASASQVAFGYERLAELACWRGDFDEQARMFRLQHATIDALCRSCPDRVDLRYDRSLALGNLMTLALAAGNHDEALALSDAALKDAEAALASDPESRAFREGDATSRIRKANVLRLRGDLAGARIYATEGVAALKELAITDPGKLQSLCKLQEGFVSLIHLCMAEGNRAGARNYCERATDIGNALLAARPDDRLFGAMQQTMHGLQEQVSARDD